MEGAGRRDSGGLFVTVSSLIMQRNHSHRGTRDAVGVYIYSLSEATKVLRPNALDSSTLAKKTAGGRHILHILPLALLPFYFLLAHRNSFKIPF